MLYGVTPPELCRTTRSILRAPQSESGFSASHVDSAQGASLRRGCDRAPRWRRNSRYKEVRGLHVLLGEWLRGARCHAL